VKKMAPIQAAALLTFIVVGSVSAGAQSPPPGQLAPGSSGRVIAPQGQAPSPQPRTSIPDPAPGGNTVQTPGASGVAPLPSPPPSTRN
jgi:hypothetical protein